MSSLHFDVMSGLKRVLGRELITNDEVALFELVKNSFDAAARRVFLYFGDDSIVIADDGHGMSYDDIVGKWLSVAYSAKRRPDEDVDFRQMAAERGAFAGSKGIGRFSSDRLGSQVILQTRSKKTPKGVVNKLVTDWSRFEEDDQRRFESIPVEFEEAAAFVVPPELKTFGASLKHGTVIEIRDLRQTWSREDIKRLKSALSKLINPFGSDIDDFSIIIIAPGQLDEDRKIEDRAGARGEDVPVRDIVNGRVGNFIFSALSEKTTFITVWIEKDYLYTTLTDRGALIYSIREPNPYPLLEEASLRCDIYYLNQSAKVTFARRVGLPSVRFGNIFLFRNGFRVFPIGEEDDDWFGINRRKQQGYSRFLGTREVIGRVDVSGPETEFQEASSRNQGLIATPAVDQLQEFVMNHGLKRLERYVVPVSWVDKGDATAEDLSRLMTEPGRARVTKAVAALVDNEGVELLDYNHDLITLLNERASEFEASIVSLRTIAEKTGDKALFQNIETAEKRFEELKAAELEARRIADQERELARRAEARAQEALSIAERAQSEADTERRRSHFLESMVDQDNATIVNLHHQVTIYSINAAQQIENFLMETEGQKTVSRDAVLKAFEQLAYLNSKVYAVTRFATRAAFKLDSEKITADLPKFIDDYIEQIAKQYLPGRLRIEVANSHEGLETTFNPIDVSIVVDNLISNAAKVGASRLSFDISSLGKDGLQILANDNGMGLAKGADKDRIFEMGYSTTSSSGLGLYHVRQILGQMGGTIEVAPIEKGLSLLIKIVPKRRKAN